MSANLLSLTVNLLTNTLENPKIIINTEIMANISIGQQVYLAIAYRGTNVSALAHKMGMNRQNLHQKISRNNLKKEEMHKIAKALGGVYESFFSFPGDVIVGSNRKRR